MKQCFSFVLVQNGTTLCLTHETALKTLKFVVAKQQNMKTKEPNFDWLKVTHLDLALIALAWVTRKLQLFYS